MLDLDLDLTPRSIFHGSLALWHVKLLSFAPCAKCAKHGQVSNILELGFSNWA